MRELVLRLRRPLASTVVAAVVLVATGTGAWSYFSAGGAGTAQAGTATTEPVVITAGTPVAQLYPG